MRGLGTGRPGGHFVVASAAAGLVALALVGTARAADPPSIAQPADDGLARALAEGQISEAEFALERAVAVFRPERTRDVYGYVEPPDPREGTIILRDLAARVPELSPTQRALAERILARPTDRLDAIHGYRTGARRVCGTRMCFWWVRKTSDAPRLYDGNRNRVPDWVDFTRKTFGDVWRRQVRHFGYRAPRSDRPSRNDGGDGRLDVYVADVGADGLYGYCTTDDPGRRVRRNVSAYCVVDDDFTSRQFAGSAFGRRALQVTAAHELFHAVQYAYDWLEDLWLMEGTATWIEDEIYDRVNDNRQYLRTSPLSTRPEFSSTSLDYHSRDPAESGAGFKYGVWIFWRYLSERFGREIVREVWARADARPRAPDEYSARALVSALRARGATLGTVLGDFAAANVTPATTYSEGAAYPVPRPAREFVVTPTGLPRVERNIPHLAAEYIELVPQGIDPAATLAITLDLPAPVTAPSASALVQMPDGSLTRIPAVQDEVSGRWRIDVPGFAGAQRVRLALTNASTRYRCWRGTVYSCRGKPLDDTVVFGFEAALAPVAPGP